MADTYRYPVFLECHSLLKEQMRKIEKYFLIRRRSGGGDCGPLKRVDDKTYCVAFRYERDQQAVLQRLEHVVDGLVFTVRGSREPQTSSSNTVSTSSRDSTAPATSSHFVHVTSGEEYELQLDPYLLRYLKECPKAGKELEEELASVASSALLFPDDEKVLVRKLTQPGGADEDRNWKVEVDKVFDGYQCHYEVNPHKIKALLQSCRSGQTTDEVKVFSEVGVAVVVGKTSQVNAKLLAVEDRSSLSEKQSSIHRLGEAKLRLLWKDIERSLGRDFPGVKVTQGDAGQLVLEGSVEEILKAGNLITEKENLVLERTVSDMSPHFLAFLKKAYGEPGLLGAFLGVGDNVEIELRDTELRIFSLSNDNLDETEKALQSKIKDIKIDVHNCSVVSPEVRNRLDPSPDSLLQDRLSVDSGSFLPTPSGKIELSDTHNFACLSMSEENTVFASYSLLNGIQVLVCHGDITKQHADALVNAANEDLDHCGGVAAALSKAGGPEVQRESKVLVKQTGKVQTGEVVVTTGGKLNCKKLLHAVGPVAGKAGGRERILLEEAVRLALNVSEIEEFQSIAIPCIGSGSCGIPVTVCSEAIVTAVKEFGSQGGRSLSRIILIDNREEVVRTLCEACDRLLQGLTFGNAAPSHLGFKTDGTAPNDTATGATAGAPGTGVHLEIIQGNIETQHVDAVVAPMVGHDPYSTRIGNILSEMIGSQLAARFIEEVTEPGETVLVEDLPGLPTNAVFFLNLIPWDDDEDGVAVQVLRLGIQNILTLCDNREFESVAFPLLGAGIALRFPDSVVASVLLEEIHTFKQKPYSKRPLLAQIIIHPDDEESSETFKCIYEPFQLKEPKNDVYQPHQVSATKRIVLLGKTGSGKSSLANTIFGETMFMINHSPNSGTSECQAETKTVNGRSITLIDTPGFFDAERSEEDLKSEIMRCITECAPGPHAFLIVLKVEKFTEHEQAVIDKICQYFSEDALKYAVIVFTRGGDLPKGVKIQEFVSQNKNLNDLVQKCSGRCHVVDNKHWNNNQENNYRSNQFQVEELLKTIDEMVMENKGGYYNNKMFQAVEEEIQREEKHIRQGSGNISPVEIRKQAKSIVSKKCLNKLAGVATGAFLGAFFGLEQMVGLVMKALNNPALITLVKSQPVRSAFAAASGKAVNPVGLVCTTAAAAAIGGFIGFVAADGAESPLEAAEMTADALRRDGKPALKLH